MRGDGLLGCSLCSKCHDAYRRMVYAEHEPCAACGCPCGSKAQSGKFLLFLPCGGCEVPTVCCTLHLRLHRCDTGVTEQIPRRAA